MYNGDIRLGDTIDIKFTSRQFSTGAPFTLAGSPAVAAYVGNGTTEITSGITLSVDFDLRTGLNNVRVVASSGNGFATATNVTLVITAGTVDGVSVVGETIGSFSIEARSAVMPTVAARTLDVTATGEAGIDWANIGAPTTAQDLSGTSTKALEPTTSGRKLDVSAGGEAGLDWANIGSPTTTQNLSGTTVKAVTDAVSSNVTAINSVSTASVTAVNANLGTTQPTNFTGTGASALVKSDTVDIAGAAVSTSTAQIGTNVINAAGTAWNSGAIGASTLAADTITAAKIAAGAITSAKFAASAIDATAIATDAITSTKIASSAYGAIADAVADEAYDGAVTLRQSVRLANSANGAIVSGAATTTVAIRDLADTKDRITATVDASGNRTAVSRDLT